MSFLESEDIMGEILAPPVFVADPAKSNGENLYDYAVTIWGATTFSRGKKAVPTNMAGAMAVLSANIQNLMGAGKTDGMEPTGAKFDLSTLNNEPNDTFNKAAELIQPVTRLMITYTVPARLMCWMNWTYKLHTTGKNEGTVVLAMLLAKVSLGTLQPGQ